MSEVKKIGSRAEVFHGTAQETTGGLKKTNLKKKDGRIISKALSKPNPSAKMWSDSVKKAYKELKLDGFVPVRQGEPLHERAKKIFEKEKKKAAKKK